MIHLQCQQELSDCESQPVEKESFLYYVIVAGFTLPEKASAHLISLNWFNVLVSIYILTFN